MAIPTRNRPELLGRVLSSLAQQSTRPEHVIVIDDSDEELRESVDTVVLQTSLDVRLLRKPAPGLAASRNLAADECSSELILYLDDDVVLDKGYVATILGAFEDQHVIGAGGVIVNSALPSAALLKEFLGVTGRSNGRVMDSGWPTSLPRSNAPTEFLSGCNMAYRTRIVREERFDHRFFRGYGLGEDLEFSHRLYRRRGRLRIVASAHLWHFSETRPSGKSWGREEVRKCPLVADLHFSKPRFAVASFALAISNLVHGDAARSVGNIEEMLRVLRAKPISFRPAAKP